MDAFPKKGGDWLWVTRDAPLISVGGPQTLARRTDPPVDPNRLAAILFDNCWHTNFVADSYGTLEFSFGLAWRQRIDQAGRTRRNPDDSCCRGAESPRPHEPASMP